MDPSKCLFIADSQGRARAYSPEETLAGQLSAWKGWHCSAGVDNIFINGEGKIFIASCAIGGIQGNVYRSGNKVRDKWFVCTKGLCTCGADMRLAKVKNVEDIPKLRGIKAEDLDYTAPMGEPTMVGRLWEPDISFNLNWDLSRRCNYSCSYCSWMTSNNFDPHRSWEELSFAVEEIERFFCQGRKGKWVFTGGEPTLHPDYLRLVKQVAARGHLIHTQSNGSRSPEFYGELLEHSLIGFSVHLDFVKMDRFITVIEKLIELKASGPPYEFNWVGVRIMAGPGRSAEALEIRRSLSELPGSEKYINQLVLAPLYDRETASRLQEYPEGELELISRHS
jgi:pyruvate-formate lyase-activating enzyme